MLVCIGAQCIVDLFLHPAVSVLAHHSIMNVVRLGRSNECRIGLPDGVFLRRIHDAAICRGNLEFLGLLMPSEIDAYLDGCPCQALELDRKLRSEFIILHFDCKIRCPSAFRAYVGQE